jgi:hypothetical protein
MASETIEMLLAIGEAGKSLRKRNAAEVLGVPAWAGQCPGGGGEKSPVFCGRKHAYFSSFTNRKLRCIRRFVELNSSL